MSHRQACRTMAVVGVFTLLVAASECWAGFSRNSAVGGISINTSGQVFVSIDGQVDPTLVGQFNLTTFPNASGLEAIGGNLFLETASSGTPTTGTAGDLGFGLILQGSLENSNVNVVQEITSLITAQRAYEMNAQVIEAADEMAQTATNI